MNWALWGVLVVCIIIAALPILSYPLGRDQGEFATIASVLLRGGVPYVDVWNPKPPAIFYTYAGAIALFGQTAWAVRMLDLMLFPLMALALYGIGRQLSMPAVGLWAVLLYGVAYFGDTFWTLSQNDGIGSIPMALAVWCAVTIISEPQRAHPIRAFITGGLAALVLWFKYPFIAFVVVLLIGYLSARRPLRLSEMIAFSIGGMLVGFGGMVLLAWGGALAAWWESARVTAGYTAQGYNLETLIADLTRYAGYRWREWGFLWILAALGCAGVCLHGAKTGHKRDESIKPLVTDRRIWTIIVVWLVGSAVAMLIQAKGYDYHWLPMLPPLSLLGGYAVNQATKTLNSFELLPRWSRVGVIAFIALNLFTYLSLQTWGRALPYLIGTQSQSNYYASFVGGEYTASSSLQVTEYLSAQMPPGSSLFVWGFRPELYYLTQTHPATRFIFQFPLVASWYPVEWQQQTVDRLWGALPPYVVVVRGDHMPWVTGRDADSNTLLQEFTELNNWLMFNYEPDTEFESFIIWRLRDSTGEPN